MLFRNMGKEEVEAAGRHCDSWSFISMIFFVVVIHIYIFSFFFSLFALLLVKQTNKQTNKKHQLPATGRYFVLSRTEELRWGANTVFAGYLLVAD